MFKKLEMCFYRDRPGKKKLGKFLLGGAVSRIKCNWIYMASLKRRSRGSGCHMVIDPGNVKRKACKKVVVQGGNLLRKMVLIVIKGEIWVIQIKKVISSAYKASELKLSRV